MLCPRNTIVRVLNFYFYFALRVLKLLLLLGIVINLTKNLQVSTEEVKSLLILKRLRRASTSFTMAPPAPSSRLAVALAPSPHLSQPSPARSSMVPRDPCLCPHPPPIPAFRSSSHPSISQPRPIPVSRSLAPSMAPRDPRLRPRPPPIPASHSRTYHSSASVLASPLHDHRHDDENHWGLPRLAAQVGNPPVGRLPDLRQIVA
jgi:hypothetical protein